MPSIIDSFSYQLRDVADVTDAKDKAKEKGISFSEYLLQLIKSDLKKKT